MDWEQSQQEAANLSATINEILDSYDSKLRPNAGGKCMLIGPLTPSHLPASHKATRTFVFWGEQGRRIQW